MYPMSDRHCCPGCYANPGLYDDFGDTEIRRRLELMRSVAPCNAWNAAEDMRSRRALGLHVRFPGDN